ncbi:hypothetical protein EG68_00389 [Paragonimus skrjabini miyazakii]|uniref:Uncharacterized protein n=1 Tax=Paragonimus skrjabini miyazakii TaxID=59628 RepID=A0A8S9Z9S1_9TREM|nr:hypothetical protein EG68_00389 [Paragonimus skrjabini miyazakii]
MDNKASNKPRGFSRAHVYRLAKLAREERSGSNCKKRRALAIDKGLTNPPILQHFQDESSLETIPCFVENVEECLPADARFGDSVLRTTTSAVNPSVIIGNSSTEQDPAFQTTT